MTAIVYPSRDVTNALIEALTAALGTVGDADAPEDRTLPYAVLYPLGTSLFDGSLDADGAQADAWPTWQLTYVAASRDQADWLRAKTRSAVLGTVLAVDGWSAGPLRLLDEQPAQRDDDVNPPLFYAVDRFRLYTTPR